jgi:hypothetical protein
VETLVLVLTARLYFLNAECPVRRGDRDALDHAVDGSATWTHRDYSSSKFTIRTCEEAPPMSAACSSMR